MIQIYSIDAKGNKSKHTFETTIFPDKTSQCWKINPEPIKNEVFQVEWKFENEAEIFHLYQLGDLILTLTQISPSLEVDTLPFARQDKEISNNSTFAKSSMLSILSNRFREIKTIDVHSVDSEKWPHRCITNKIPNERIQEVLKISETDIVCFPDKGASKRGYIFDEEYYGSPLILDKDRDPLTGEIRGLKFATKARPDLTGHKVCIVDDLCDRGGTFIAAAKILKAQGASKIFLYTTHGLYTGGTKIIFNGGIDRIFNYKEEIFNTKE